MLLYYESNSEENQNKKMLSLLMNKLAKNEKYDIYLISNHNKIDNFEFNKNIKIL